MYLCAKCKKTFDKQDFIVCPYCGTRIVNTRDVPIKGIIDSITDLNDNPIPHNGIYFGLIDDGRHIILIACDKEGNRIDNGSMLKINKDDKRLLMQWKFNDEIGFKLDDHGAVIVE